MRAHTLPQPWAQLIVTHQPCARCGGTGNELLAMYRRCSECGGTGHGPMVKRWETRSWPLPPALIGQRIAIHAAAAKRPPSFWMHERDDICHAVNHHGRTVNPGVPFDRLDAFYDITESSEADGWFLYRWAGGPLGAVVGSCIVTASLPIVTPRTVTPQDNTISNLDGRLVFWPADEGGVDISDQLPYGDWTPGRHAWQIEQAAPTTERCPWCWNADGWVWAPGMPGPCPVCKTLGYCDPIPWESPGGRLPEWTP